MALKMSASKDALAGQVEITTRFDRFLAFNLKRLLNMQLGFTLNVLSNLIKWLRYIFRFEMLHTLQRKLFGLYRDRIAAARGLPPVTHLDIEMTHVLIKVPGENIELRGNLYLPVDAIQGKIQVPAVLIRTPYDKDSPFMGPGIARIFAERGYGCLVQDTRGRFGSGGDFFPIAHEVKDGTCTVEWLRAQTWCNKKVGTFGISYLGLTAYAAGGGGQPVDACVPVMACSRLYPIIYHGGSAFAFDLVIRWLWLVINVMQEKNPLKKMAKLLTPHRQLEIALHPVGVTPVHHRDYDVVGKELDFYRQVMESHDLGHDFWTAKDVLCDLSKKESSPPLSIVAGWHDIFVAQSFKDFEVASKVPTDAPLTMTCGPWSHWDFLHYSAIGFDAAFDLFESQLKGVAKKQEQEFDHEQQTRPTRIFVQVMHSETAQNPHGTWMKFSSWPPVQRTKQVPFFLGRTAGGKLVLNSDEAKGTEAFTEHVYDPRDPTPHFGGPGFDWTNSGRTVQNELEGRDDVLVFTSQQLRERIVVVGQVTMKMHFWSSNPHTDIFVKLCDVEGSSMKSMNVMEKMTRLSTKTHEWDAEGNVYLEIDLGPIAVEFKKGNFVRIQVSGAAHPLYLRSSGSDNHTVMDMKPALRRVMHSREFPTSLNLPVLRLQ